MIYNMIKTGTLRHGGIMANYECSAACRHCLYACSPDRSGGYVTADTAREICAALYAGGCRSVHIGGGEPFLDLDGLIELVRAVNSAGITLEYIETNAFWAKDERAALEMLDRLARAGADTLCISLDPFHAEYVPFEMPLKLAKLCERSRMGYFLWQQRFLRALSRVDPSRAHSRASLERQLSARYIADTSNAYGLTYGGRAVNIEMEYAPRRTAEELIDSRPCRRLMSTDHFHVDLYGRFIPPGCTGIAVPLAEAVNGLPTGRYPVFEALYTGGTASLLEYARTLGFVPDAGGYSSSCALCFFIRRWLTENAPSAELDAEHYTAAMSWY